MVSDVAPTGVEKTGLLIVNSESQLDNQTRHMHVHGDPIPNLQKLAVLAYNRSLPARMSQSCYDIQQKVNCMHSFVALISFNFHHSIHA